MSLPRTVADVIASHVTLELDSLDRGAETGTQLESITSCVPVSSPRDIARGEIEPTQYDLNYYSHELRESVRYRRQGFPTGAGDDYELWNNAHTATLQDYGLRELDANRNRNLFHPDAWPFLPR
jgi:hypothetical protein